MSNTLFSLYINWFSQLLNSALKLSIFVFLASKSRHGVILCWICFWLAAYISKCVVLPRNRLYLFLGCQKSAQKHMRDRKQNLQQPVECLLCCLELLGTAYITAATLLCSFSRSVTASTYLSKRHSDDEHDFSVFLQKAWTMSSWSLFLSVDLTAGISKFLSLTTMSDLLHLLWISKKVTEAGMRLFNKHQNRFDVFLDFQKLKTTSHVCSSGLCLLLSFKWLKHRLYCAWPRLCTELLSTLFQNHNQNTGRRVTCSAFFSPPCEKSETKSPDGSKSDFAIPHVSIAVLGLIFSILLFLPDKRQGI